MSCSTRGCSRRAGQPASLPQAPALSFVSPCPSRQSSFSIGRASLSCKSPSWPTFPQPMSSSEGRSLVLFCTEYPVAAVVLQQDQTAQRAAVGRTAALDTPTASRPLRGRADCFWGSSSQRPWGSSLSVRLESGSCRRRRLPSAREVDPEGRKSRGDSSAVSVSLQPPALDWEAPQKGVADGPSRATGAGGLPEAAQPDEVLSRGRSAIGSSFPQTAG